MGTVKTHPASNWRAFEPAGIKTKTCIELVDYDVGGRVGSLCKKGGKEGDKSHLQSLFNIFLDKKPSENFRYEIPFHSSISPIRDQYPN